MIEAVNTGMTHQKDVVGSGFNEVPGLDSTIGSLLVCPTFSNFRFTWNIDNTGKEENDEYSWLVRNMNHTIFTNERSRTFRPDLMRAFQPAGCSQEETAAGNVTGMEKEERGKCT